MKSYLCVGGPHAGMKYKIDGHHFSVPINMPKMADALPADLRSLKDFEKWASTPTTVETVTYKEEKFYTPQGSITFWVPDGQTSYETMVLLLEGYGKIEEQRKVLAKALKKHSHP